MPLIDPPPEHDRPPVGAWVWVPKYSLEGRIEGYCGRDMVQVRIEINRSDLRQFPVKSLPTFAVDQVVLVHLAGWIDVKRSCE